MKKFFTTAVILSTSSLLITSSPVANAIDLNTSLEVWNELSAVQFEEGEMISPMAKIKRDLLKNCKTELDYQVGTTIRVVNQYQATVGLGKLTSVKIGKVYRAIQPLYGRTVEDDETATPQPKTDEWVPSPAPRVEGPTLNPTFIAPCIFSGTVRNLRSAEFYALYIGGGKTGEYDSVTLRKKGWKLNLFLEQISCGNFRELKIPRGCEY